MKVIEKAVMPNGTNIQINDWSEDYNFCAYGNELAAYAISKNTCKGTYGPKSGVIYRFSFTFDSYEECKEAFEWLKTGEVDLIDYAQNLRQNSSNDTFENYKACL